MSSTMSQAELRQPSKEEEEHLLDSSPVRSRSLWNPWRILAAAGACLLLVSTYRSRGTITCTRILRDLTYDERARDILRQNPLIDGHNDLLILIRGYFQNHINDEGFTTKFENGGMPGHVDLPRIREGMYTGAFWSAFMPCPANGSNFEDSNYHSIVKATYEQIDLFYRLQERYPRYFTPPEDSEAAMEAFDNRMLISPLAIEGLHQIGNSAATLRDFFRLGVRYATLTWNCNNIYADAAITMDPQGNITGHKPYWHGVSPAGHAIVREMNRLGMIVDLSHVSKDTMVDVLGGAPHKGWNGSAAPPIFSHSSAYALCPHPRNVPDDVLQLVKARNSLVMINVAPDFISCTASDSDSGLPDYFPANNTIEHVVRHVRHIGDLIGYAHVGLGTDFDGIGDTPRGFEDVSKFPDLVAEMLRQGISDQDAAKVVGMNLLRVWREVDKVAREMQGTTPPLEDDMEKPW